MPRFFFHLHDDVDAPDPEGIELPDLYAALAHALADARFTMAETIKATGRIVLSHHIDIEDESGCVLETVRFSDAVEIEQ